MTKSENLFQLLVKYTPGGSQTLSKMANRYPAVYPKVLSHGKAGHVFDIEGNEYIDLISGLGAISLGYTDPYINQVIETQLHNGISFSLPTAWEYHLSKKLTDLVPWTEQWKFGKTGTDGVLMAVRAARAITGKQKILTFGYHGCTDHFECLGVRKAGMLDMSTYTRKLLMDYTTTEQYAAVVLEPWILEQTITQELRDWCNRTKTILIADEVVTGGRFQTFSASSFIKIQPDIIVMGKGLANGLPLCAVGGTRRLMSVFERDDFFASGTFNGETLSLAAGVATSETLSSLIPKMVWNGSRIKESFNKLSWPDNTQAVGYPTRLDFQFKTPQHKYLFWQEMCKNGVLVGYNNFIMANHTDEDTTKIIDAIFNSFKVLKQYWKDPMAHIDGALPENAVLRKN